MDRAEGRAEDARPAHRDPHERTGTGQVQRALGDEARALDGVAHPGMLLDYDDPVSAGREVERRRRARRAGPDDQDVELLHAVRDRP
jgi:hypothetical protein